MRGWAETPFVLTHNGALEVTRSCSWGTCMSPGHSGEGLRPRGTQSCLSSRTLEVMGHFPCPCFPQVTPSLGLQAQRPGFSRPPCSLVVLTLLPGGPHALPSPSIQPGAVPPSGIALQDGLQESPFCPDTHSWSLSSLLGAAQAGLGVLGDQLFQDARRCQVLSEPPTQSLHPPRPGWGLCGGDTRRPPAGLPGCPEWECQAWPSPPAPSVQLSRHCSSLQGQ